MINLRSLLFFFRRRKHNFTLGDIPVEIVKDPKGFRVNWPNGGVLLENLPVEVVKSLLSNNFELVYTHFHGLADALIPDLEIQQMSVNIVTENLVVNNVLRNSYHNFADLDLGFRSKDLRHPTTQYDVVNFLRNNYPGNYADKAMVLLEMSAEQFAGFEKMKQEFEGKPTQPAGGTEGRIIRPEITPL